MKETKNNGLAIIKAHEDFFNFALLRERLGKEPTQTAKTPDGKHDEIPISVLEAELDDAFGPLCWQTKNYKTEIHGVIGKSQYGDELVLVWAYITLEVWNPAINQWISRDGSIGTSMTWKQGTTKPGALVSLVTKNAAKKFGKRFGRDLNRNIVETSTDELIEEQVFPILEKAQSIPELNKLYREMSQGRQLSQGAKDAYNKIREELTKQKGGKP